MILKIKAELLSLFKRNLFCLCINIAFYAAWILMAVIVGYRFFFQQHFFSSGTSSMQPFFSSLPYVSILVFPLLTLLMTDEKVEALLPFGRFTLNLVKLFSLIIAFCVMLLPLIAIPFCVSFFGDIDAGSLFTGFIGVILYSFVAFSLTLFISAFCEKNVVAFLVSAVVLAIIDSSHLFPVYTGVTGPFVGLMQEISFAWHFDSFGKGILDTRDIIFFIVFSVFFVFLASFIHSVRAEDKRYKGIFIPLVVNLVLLLLLGNKLYIRADLSKEKQFTISSYSENTLKNVAEPLRITYCVSPELSRLYPQVKDVEDYLFMYAASKYADKLAVSIVNPSSKKGEALIKDFDLQSQQFRTAGKNKTEYLQVYSAIIIEYLDKNVVLPYELSTATLEYDLTRSLEYLVLGIERSVYIMSGNGIDIQGTNDVTGGYSFVVPWLTAHGIKSEIITETDLDALDKNIPLVLFGSSALSPLAIDSIASFIDGGGKAFFAVSPYTVDILHDNWKVINDENQSLISLLQAWGFSFRDSLVADVSCNQIMLDGMDDSGNVDSSNTLNYPLWLSVLPQENTKNGLNMFWASPMELSSSLKPLFVSTPSAWLMSPDSSTVPFEVKKIAGEGDETGQFILGAEGHGLIVIPDQYFVHSLLLSMINNGALPDFRNLDFLSNAVLHLQNADELSSLQKNINSMLQLYKLTDEGDFLFFRNITLFISFILLPLIIIGCAFCFKAWRKNAK